jgi:hypothetical protein
MTYQAVSVLVPTRGRVAMVDRLLASFDATTAGRAEIVFRCDHDDEATWTYLGGQDRRIIVGPRLDGYWSLASFFNDLAAGACGDVFLCGNDDMVFVTPGWDARILAAANAYPDGIFDVNVRTHNARVYPFATISRAARDALGFLWDPRVQLGDLWWRDVCAAYGRLRTLDDVRIDHDWAGHHPDRTHVEADPGSIYRRRPNYGAEHAAAVADAIARLACLPSP